MEGTRSGQRPGGAGWTFVHSIVDDYTRIAHSEPLPDEKAATVAAFTARALDDFRRNGITDIAEIMCTWLLRHFRHHPLPAAYLPRRPSSRPRDQPGPHRIYPKGARTVNEPAPHPALGYSHRRLDHSNRTDRPKLG